MTGKKPTSDDPALDAIRVDFIERIGLVAQSEGLPRTSGRLFGLLIFDGTAHAFGDLATALQVSRASISTSVRLLEERGLIRRVTRPGSRQDYLQLSDNPFEALIETAQKRVAMARREIEAVRDALPKGATGPESRLSSYANFYRSIETGLDGSRKYLRDEVE